MELAVEQQAVVITEDKDFGELVFRQRRMNAGVVLYRLAGLSPPERLERVVQAFDSHSELFPGRFTVISLDQIRVRLNLSLMERGRSDDQASAT